METIKWFFGFIGRPILLFVRMLIYGKVLQKKTGSKILQPKETKGFLSSRNKGLLIDGIDKRLSVKESFQNVCFVARVGAGKTTRYIIPNVLDKANQNVSMVINDPKGEIYQETAGILHKRGYSVQLYSPNSINISNLYNPLAETQNEIEIEQVAETLIWSGNPGEQDPFWNNGAIRITSVLLKCLSFSNPKHFNLPNLYMLLQNFGEMGEGLEHWISKNCWNPAYPSDPYLLNEWKGVLTGNPKTIQTFVGICLTALKAMSSREMQLFTSRSDYKLKNLRKKKTAIFFVTPAQNAGYYSFITSLFFRSVFNECMREHHLKGKSLPVYILYDEFGNSYIPDFVSVSNTIRGYGVSLSIILQSISQLGMKYGQNTADSIMGAFNTNICLSSSDPTTSYFFSNLAGIVRERQVRDILKDVKDHREYKLLNPDDVRTMQEDEALVISKNRYPVKLKTKPYFQNRIFRKASKFPAPQIDKSDRKGKITYEKLV